MALAPCGTKTDEQGRELAQHGSAQFPVACYHDDLTRESVPWHWHPELEAFVISEGAAVVAVGSARFTLGQGEGIFINASVLHAVWPHGRSRCRLYSVVFHPRLVGGSPDSVFWFKYLQPLLGGEGRECVRFDGTESWHGQAVQAMEAAWKSCADELRGYEFRTREELSRLIFLLSQHQPPVPPAKSGKVLRDEGRVKLMLEYVHQHYGSQLTAAAIARAAAVSESECLRCFRSIIGLTPIQYVTQYRVQKAAELLSASALTIAEVGAKCGFQDASYFTKTFHALKGCTPSVYRGRDRGEAENALHIT